MNWEIENKNNIQIFKRMGMNKTDSLVYSVLMKFGPDGTVVYNLIHKLQYKIKRTTLYSILKKLSELGAVEILEENSSPRNAKKYRVISPKNFFSNFIKRKKRELRQIEEMKGIFDKELESIYQYGINYQNLELDTNIKPYIDFLREKGWKIKLYTQEENVPVFNYSVYECNLEPPDTLLYKDVYFHLFIFDYSIAEDTNGLQFTMKSIKNQSKELIRIYGNISQFSLNDITYFYAKKEFSAYIIKIQTDTLINHELYPKLLDFLQIEKEGEIPKEIEIGIGVFIPIKNKIFYIWAESKNLIDETMEIISKLNFK